MPFICLQWLQTGHSSAGKWKHFRPRSLEFYTSVGDNMLKIWIWCACLMSWYSHSTYFRQGQNIFEPRWNWCSFMCTFSETRTCHLSNDWPCSSSVINFSIWVRQISILLKMWPLQLQAANLCSFQQKVFALWKKTKNSSRVFYLK